MRSDDEIRADLATKNKPLASVVRGGETLEHLNAVYRLSEDVPYLLARRQAVLGMHKPVEYARQTTTRTGSKVATSPIRNGVKCRICSDGEWPCATVNALGGAS